MKKYLVKTVLILLPTLFFGTLQAQEPTSTLAELPLNGNVQNTLIRSCEGKMLYYVRTTNENYFAFNAVGAVETRRALLPMNYEVSDMEVHENLLYFCGRDNAQNRGFIGVFNIIDVLFNNDTYTIHTGFAMQNVMVNDIRRLCVYLDTIRNFTHVVAVGEVNNFGCVIEIKEAPAGNVAWTYRNCVADNHPETFIDVVVTDSYVVTAGHYDNSNTYIALRTYNKRSITSSSYYDTIYPFPSCDNDTHIYYGYEDFRLTYLENNNVATYSTMRKRGILPATRRNGLLLNVFYIPTMLATANYTPIYTTVISSNDLSGRAAVKALCYDKWPSRLVGMAHYWGTGAMTNTDNSWTTEMGFFPAPATTFTTRYNDQYWYEDGIMDTIHDRYFAIGQDATDPQLLVLMSNDYDNNPSCENIIMNTHPDSYLVMAKEERRPLSNYDGTTTRVQAQPIDVNTLPINYPCKLTD